MRSHSVWASVEVSVQILIMSIVHGAGWRSYVSAYGKASPRAAPGVRQVLQLVSLGARIRALDVSCLRTQGQSYAHSSGGETAQFCDPLQTVPRVCVCLHVSTPVCVRGGVLDSRTQVCVLGLQTPVYPSGPCTSLRLRAGRDLRFPSLDETRARAPPTASHAVG